MTTDTGTGMSESEAHERNGYLTTFGRVTGREHEIEIWFAVEPESMGTTLYILSGGRDRSDWVRNVARNPAVRFRAGKTTYHGTARIVEPDNPVDSRSRVVVALPVVIELDGRAGDMR